MDEIKEHFNNHLEKIKMIENFVALSLRREKIDGQYSAITKEAEEVRKLMAVAHEVMQNELDNVEAEYEEVMRRMRRQQAVILDHVLKERQRKVKKEEEEEKRIQDLLDEGGAAGGCTMQLLQVPASANKALVQNFAKMKLNLGATPKMTIYDYKESPLVKRTKVAPIPFSFLEFEFQIAPRHFETIPKYMRGRETLDDLNHFLETIIVPCFNEKYQLLHRHRSSIRNQKDLELWKVYNEQASYVPERHFITPGDISRKINKMIDKKMQNRVAMLRHIGLLQMISVAQTICYIWTANLM